LTDAFVWPGDATTLKPRRNMECTSLFSLTICFESTINLCCLALSLKINVIKMNNKRLNQEKNIDSYIRSMWRFIRENIQGIENER